ncbi:MAG: GntR family transcriptional regulator [Bacteroidota bacterium]
MIDIDRGSALPVSEQLVQQLRYLIGAGRYRSGELLPSTRALGEQLGLSFHTVRKAYQALESDGLVEAKPGSGFWVAERAPLTPSERRERGATIVEEALRALVGMGLSEDEIDLVIQEQLAFREPPEQRRKVLFVGTYVEEAETGARHVEAVLQEPVDPITLAALDAHSDADLIVTAHTSVAGVQRRVPRAEVEGVLLYPPRAVLDAVARLSPAATLGLAARHTDALAPIRDALRFHAGFSGQVLALPASASRDDLEPLLGQLDYLLYTSAMRRRFRSLAGSLPHAEYAPQAERSALELIRDSYSR